MTHHNAERISTAIRQSDISLDARSMDPVSVDRATKGLVEIIKRRPIIETKFPNVAIPKPRARKAADAECGRFPVSTCRNLSGTFHAGHFAINRQNPLHGDCP